MEGRLSNRTASFDLVSIHSRSVYGGPGMIAGTDRLIRRADDGALDRQRSSHGVTTIISGVFTLVLLGVTSYFAYKSIMYSGSESATPPAPLKGEDTLRLVQRIIFPVVASALVLIVFILRVSLHPVPVSLQDPCEISRPRSLTDRRFKSLVDSAE